MEIIHPEGWKAARGYSNGIVIPADARTLFIAGQIAWNAQQELVGREDFARQFAQALDNVVAVVTAAGGTGQDLVQLTVFVTDKQAYLASTRAIGEHWKQTIGRHYPTMALVEVADLLEEGALVEIQGVAALR